MLLSPYTHRQVQGLTSTTPGVLQEGCQRDLRTLKFDGTREQRTILSAAIVGSQEQDGSGPGSCIQHDELLSKVKEAIRGALLDDLRMTGCLRIGFSLWSIFAGCKKIFRAPYSLCLPR